MRPLHNTTVALALLTFASTITAQGSRELHTSSDRYILDTEFGGLSVAPKSKSLIWAWTTNTSGYGSTTIDLSVADFHVGAIAHLGDRQFLVSGRVPNGAGVLARVRCVETPTRAIVVDQVQQYVGSDFLHTAWNSKEKKLYAVDAIKKCVRHAEWSGPQSPLPDSLEVAVDATTLPLLDVNLLTVSLDSDAMAAGFAARILPSTVEYRVAPVDAGWSVSRVSTSKTGLMFKNSDRSKTTEAWVTAPYPTLFSIVDVAKGVAVHNGSVGLAWQTVHVKFSPELIPGRQYELREYGKTSGSPFWPLRRYGEAQSTSNLQIERGLLPADRSSVGEQVFAVGAECRFTPVSTQPRLLSATLRMAMRAPNQPDPVSLSGTAATLQPDNIYGSQVTIPAGSEGSAAAFPLPLPTDPALIGSRASFQILILDPSSSQYAFTDVFVTTLAASSDAARAAESLQVSAGAKARLDAAARLWTTRMTPSDRKLTHEQDNQIRRQLRTQRK